MASGDDPIKRAIERLAIVCQRQGFKLQLAGVPSEPAQGRSARRPGGQAVTATDRLLARLRGGGYEEEER